MFFSKTHVWNYKPNFPKRPAEVVVVNQLTKKKIQLKSLLMLYKTPI